MTSPDNYSLLPTLKNGKSVSQNLEAEVLSFDKRESSQKVTFDSREGSLDKLNERMTQLKANLAAYNDLEQPPHQQPRRGGGGGGTDQENLFITYVDCEDPINSAMVSNRNQSQDVQLRRQSELLTRKSNNNISYYQAASTYEPRFHLTSRKVSLNHISGTIGKRLVGVNKEYEINCKKIE